MTVHKDTDGLLTYQQNRYPTLPGGEAKYLTDELAKVAKAINKAVEVMKLIEKRLNDAGVA